jgi:hypothetical protein
MPCDWEERPQSRFQKHFPNVLEFWTDEEDERPASQKHGGFGEFGSRVPAMFVKQDKLLALLSTFTNNHFFRYDESEEFWGFPLLSNEDGQEASSNSSKWYLRFYHFPNISERFSIECFSETLQSQIERKPISKYYTDYPNIDLYNDRPIAFPDRIDILFKYYFSLPAEMRTVIDDSTYFMANAVELRKSKRQCL